MVHAPTRRGSRFWDRTSKTIQLVERIPNVQQMYPLMINNTGLSEGHAVLDLGCGAGSYFDPVRAVIGDRGRILGVDSSADMLRRAQRRIAERGWNNVETELVNAATADLGDAEFDAVFAMYALSAMPDIAAVAARAYAALRPGGRMFVADVRLVPDGRAAALIRLLRSAYRRFAGATGDDVIPPVRNAFDSVQLIDGRGNPLDRPFPGPWPPLTMLVATKAE